MPLPRALVPAALLLLSLLGCAPGVETPAKLSAGPTPEPTSEPTAAPLQGGIGD